MDIEKTMKEVIKLKLFVFLLIDKSSFDCILEWVFMSTTVLLGSPQPRNQPKVYEHSHGRFCTDMLFTCQN